jgi:S1-C subfamily serine protease
MLPPRTAVSPGDFLFTTDGALAGLVVMHAGGPALVPGETVLNAVAGLLDQKRDAFGWLGVEVQALPSAGTSSPSSAPGVIVTWVDPAGPAAEKLFPLDVIEAVIEAAGGVAIASPADWRVRIARLTPGAPIVFRVRRGAETIDVSVTTAGRAAPPKSPALGLTMRTIRRTGVEVVQVAEGSAAARAGIREGDVITAIDLIRAPTAQQVAQAFETGTADRSILVAINRGSAHRVLALEKK